MLKDQIFPIGIGTWQIDIEHFEKELDALLYSYKQGQNYISLYMLYNNGKVVKKIQQFIEKVGRENLFININLEPTIHCIEDVEKQVNEYLQILNLDYVDSIELHSPLFTKIPLLDVYQEIQRLKDMRKTQYIGISNVNLEQLKEIDQQVKLNFFEGIYNLECKIYEDIGVVEYCKQNKIQFIAYQPLRRNRTAKRNYKLLQNLAKKYDKTQNQIILNWIYHEKNIWPLIKSTNKDRIYENIMALKFQMDSQDYQQLNTFRNSEFDNIPITWDSTNGITIDQLANQLK